MTPIATILAGLPGGYEWLIILVIILLLFGRRLPGVARSLGQGISSFKKGLSEPVDESGKAKKEEKAEKDPYERKAPTRKERAEEPVEESTEG